MSLLTRQDGKALLGAYVFDINKKVMVKNLNDSGLGKVQIVPSNGVLVDGGKAYVFVKTVDSQWYIACYDTDKNELKKGIQIKGGITSASGIVKY